MNYISEMLDELDKALPHISLAARRGILGTIKSLKPSYDTRNFWKSALLLAETANICTGGHRATKTAVAVAATGTALSVVSGKLENVKSGLHREWNSIAKEAGIRTPPRITSVPVGPIPPRVIAATINLYKEKGHIRFHEDPKFTKPVTLKYTTIFSCTRHGLTYAVDLVEGATKPYIVLEYDGDDYVFPLTTTQVNGLSLLETSRQMWIREGLSCVPMALMVRHAIISTFETERYALYPSADIATLTDSYPRQKISMDHFGHRALLDDMLKSMETGVSRSYVFYGKPGTGKTTLVKQLAWGLNRYPLIILPAAVILTAKYQLDSLADYLTQVLEIHTHAVFAIDDLDGCEIVDKNLATTQLISFLDRIKECAEFSDASYVILCTVNDPANISDTIIGRSGRVDELIHVPPPDAGCLVDTFGIDTAHSARMASLGFTMADASSACDLVKIGYDMDAAIDRVYGMLMECEKVRNSDTK